VVGQASLGHAVDLAAVLGTIFGIATSLGIGVVFLNFGLKLLFNIPEGLAGQMGLVVIAVSVATISAVTGVDRGIRRLSELNVWLTLGLAGFILVTGETIFLLNAFVLNIGDYVSNFAGLTLQTFAFDRPTGWLNGWTLSFWDVLDTAVLQPLLCHLAVEAADFPRSQLLELAPPELGDDVMVDVPLVDVVRCAGDGSPYAIGEPRG
jgi:hypothetical protein